MKASFIGRNFQFWQYRVSHGEMLIRSPKDADNPQNIDIMFAGVEYVDLPHYLPDPEIDEPNDDDMARVQERLAGNMERYAVTVLKSMNRRYLIAAAAVKVVENDMDIFACPFE